MQKILFPLIFLMVTSMPTAENLIDSVWLTENIEWNPMNDEDFFGIGSVMIFLKNNEFYFVHGSLQKNGEIVSFLKVDEMAILFSGSWEQKENSVVINSEYIENRFRPRPFRKEFMENNKVRIFTLMIEPGKIKGEVIHKKNEVFSKLPTLEKIQLPKEEVIVFFKKHSKHFSNER